MARRPAAGSPQSLLPRPNPSHCSEACVAVAADEESACVQPDNRTDNRGHLTFRGEQRSKLGSQCFEKEHIVISKLQHPPQNLIAADIKFSSSAIVDRCMPVRMVTSTFRIPFPCPTVRRRTFWPQTKKSHVPCRHRRMRGCVARVTLVFVQCWSTFYASYGFLLHILAYYWPFQYHISNLCGPLRGDQEIMKI